MKSVKILNSFHYTNFTDMSKSTMELLEFYQTVISRRDFMMRLFGEVDPSILHKTVVDRTWSSEGILRHILWSLKGAVKMFGGEPPEFNVKGIPTGGKLETEFGLSEIKDDFSKIDDFLLGLIEKTSHEKLREDVTTFFGEKRTLETQLISLLLHEVEHLGELRWIFKRLTGWTDEQVYKLRK